jgi:hypothetical protein
MNKSSKSLQIQMASSPIQIASHGIVHAGIDPILKLWIMCIPLVGHSGNAAPVLKEKMLRSCGYTGKKHTT